MGIRENPKKKYFYNLRNVEGPVRPGSRRKLSKHRDSSARFLRQELQNVTSKKKCIIR